MLSKIEDLVEEVNWEGWQNFFGKRGDVLKARSDRLFKKR
jgi:hypothetical protein